MGGPLSHVSLICDAPHYPDIATFPHHKHVILPAKRNEVIEPATIPQIGDVLREIEHMLYPDNTES